LINIDINKCVGCCTCELVCSYHHEGYFNKKYSSIKINFNDGYDLDINVLDTCDDCCGEIEPLCIQLCPTNAIKLSNIN